MNVLFFLQLKRAVKAVPKLIAGAVIPLFFAGMAVFWAMQQQSNTTGTLLSPVALVNQDSEEFLDFATTTGTVIVGAGKLGQALLDYSGFEDSGLNIMAGFDIQPKVRQSETEKPIYPINRLEGFCKCYDVRIGIIAVPAESAQRACDCLVACGIKAIWNFAPVHLKVPDYVIVQNENLAVSLTSLRMQLRDRGKDE